MQHLGKKDSICIPLVPEKTFSLMRSSAAEFKGNMVTIDTPGGGGGEDTTLFKTNNQTKKKPQLHYKMV